MVRNTGKDVAFERIRRVTGYLGTLDRFNNAKRAEESDRVKHMEGGTSVQTDVRVGLASRLDR